MLNETGIALLKDFLINNHHDGLNIVKDDDYLSIFKDAVELNLNDHHVAFLRLEENEISEGGCYLFHVPAHGYE
jgi:hypothetical protein